MTIGYVVVTLSTVRAVGTAVHHAKTDISSRMKINWHRSSGGNRNAKQGFALVITLSLMILLTVVAVGMLTLSGISMRATTQAKAMATARANARMALILAIGELQKSAGPDYRVTARSDIVSGNDTNACLTGV